MKPDHRIQVESGTTAIPKSIKERFYGRIEEINPNKISELLQHVIKEGSGEGAGGTVIFLGHVKGRVDENKVEKLVYEAYEPAASRKLDEIAKAQANNPSVTTTIILHNTGELKPGDPTILIIVTAKNRSEAFKVAREVLERVKKEPPIFKLEVREDGEYWIIGDGNRVPRKL